MLTAWPSATFLCTVASPGSWLPGVPCSASGSLTLASAVAVSSGRAAGCPAEPSAGSPCRLPSPSGPWLLVEGWAETPSPFSGAGASVSFVEWRESGSFFGSGGPSSFSGFGGPASFSGSGGPGSFCGSGGPGSFSAAGGPSPAAPFGASSGKEVKHVRIHPPTPPSPARLARDHF